VPIYQGQPVPLTFTLTTATGVLVDPSVTQPVLTITLPDTTTVLPAVTHVSTGLFTATYNTTQAGRHTVAWTCADATHPGGYADEFDVWSLTSTNVLSFLDAKAILNIPPANTTWDDLIQKVNASITEWLEWYCGAIVPKTIVEELKVGGLSVQLSWPPVNSLIAWTSVPPQFSADTSRVVPAPPSPMFPVMVYGVTYPLSQLYADPEKGLVRHTSGLPFYYGPYLWQYSCGYAIVPYAIRYAADVTLRHLFGLERGGAGGAAVAGADEMTTETPFGFAVPNRAIEALAPHQLPAAIA
jgi:hypothetical protein